MRVCLALVALVAAIGALIAAAHAGAPPPVAVSDAWVRATVEGQSGSGVFLRLTSQDDAQLVGASSPAAERVEIHEMRMVNGMMTMRRIKSLPLPAGTTVALDHDFHIMLIGLKRQLQAGQSVLLTLQVQDAKGTRHRIDVRAPVRALSTTPSPPASKRE